MIGCEARHLPADNSRWSARVWRPCHARARRGRRAAAQSDGPRRAVLAPGPWWGLGAPRAGLRPQTTQQTTLLTAAFGASAASSGARGGVPTLPGQAPG